MSKEILRKLATYIQNGETMSPEEWYRGYYEKNKHDSPQESRVSLLKRIKEHSRGLGQEDWVLDLGAGRQVLEKQGFKYFGKPSYKTVTLDFAQIKRCDLLRVEKGVEHVMADGNKLPFKDESFSILISNMAIDIMTENAIEESHRVLKPGGYLLVNLCFSHLRSSFCWEDEYSAGENPEFWKHWLKSNKPLISQPYEIRPKFQSYGFGIKAIRENSNRQGVTWWEVDMVK